MSSEDPTSTPERPENRAINAALHALGMHSVTPYISGGEWLVEVNEDLLRAAADAVYQAGREDVAKAVEAVLADPAVTYSLNNANDPEVRAGREAVRVLTPMMTETDAVRAALRIAGEQS